MRSVRVLTNLSCNQACTFCTSRQPTDVRAFVAPAAVRARIDAALAGGGKEIVLSGGDPTLRRDLDALVAYAKAGGAATVVLETNAALIDEAGARRLREAGLDVARVQLSGWGEGLDAVTRDPGGFTASVAGLRALAAAGVPVELAAALVRSTLPLLGGLAAGVMALFEGHAPPRTLWLTAPTSSPVPGERLRHEEAAAVILVIERAARALGLPVKLAPDSGPPPCVFEPKTRPAHIYSLSGGALRSDRRRVRECEACVVNDRCAGFASDYAFPLPTLHPVTDERVRRRLALISTVQEQIAREFVTPNLFTDGGQEYLAEEIIRVNFNCNQSCRFCFVSTHLPGAGDAAVRQAIEGAASRGAKITLSGGEPTLNPRLVEYVRLARSLGPRAVQLQTNAIKLDDAALTRDLVAAGVGEALVSLHGSTAEISDAVTSAPGTFARTVVGIDNLHAQAGLKLMLNFVINQANLHDLPAFIRLVAARWPRATVSISFIAPSTDLVARDLVPRYSDALPALAEALAAATRLGVTTHGFDTMCGIPLCLVPASLDPFVATAELPPDAGASAFVKPPSCEGCALGSRCFGLRRGYAELHGTGELRAVAPV
jgi:MoaA/NifB/PqqE/SkfB family radical SAM enzyme